MAFSADEPALFAGAGPLTGTLAVDTFAPIPIDGTMTLTTQLLRLIEVDRVTEIINKLVALCSVMAIETPDGAAPVLQVEGIRDKVHVHG